LGGGGGFSLVVVLGGLTFGVVFVGGGGVDGGFFCFGLGGVWGGGGGVWGGGGRGCWVCWGVAGAVFFLGLKPRSAGGVVPDLGKKNQNITTLTMIQRKKKRSSTLGVAKKKKVGEETGPPGHPLFQEEKTAHSQTLNLQGT